MHVRIPFLRPKSASIVSAGPLSVGVPLEGTDTVPGLRALERRAAAERIEGLLGVAAANGTLFLSVQRVKRGVLCSVSSGGGEREPESIAKRRIRCCCFFVRRLLTLLLRPLPKKKKIFSRLRPRA